MIYDYSVELDINDDRAYTNGLCKLEGVTAIDWVAGMNAPYTAISNPANMRIVLSNQDGRYDLDNPNSLYYGAINPGRLIRVRITYNGVTATMTELRIATVSENFGEFVTMPTLQITCTDKIKELLDFEYAPILQQDVRTDEGLTELHKSTRVVWPNNRSYFFIDVDEVDGPQQIYDLDDIDFDEGQTTLEWLGDHLGQSGQGNAQRLIRDLLKAEVFGVYFFQPRTGMYRFLNRHHATNASSTATFSTQDITNAQPRRGINPYGMGPLNTLTLDYMPRAVGAVGAILYSSDSVPFQVRPNSTKKIRGRFFDPNVADARVGGVDVIPPQDNVDIIANRQEDGSGADVLNQLVVSHSIKASQIEYVIENPTAQPIYVTTLQVRGTPLISYKKEMVEARNVDSLHTYDAFEAHDALILADEDTVQTIGDMLVNLFGEPRMVLERVTLKVAAAIAEDVQSLSMGDVTTIQNTNGTHVKDYMIMGEQHRVQIGGGLHEVTYVLRAVEYNNLFKIGSSLIDGTDVLDI